jgi:hypothetical protein
MSAAASYNRDDASDKIFFDGFVHTLGGTKGPETVEKIAKALQNNGINLVKTNFAEDISRSAGVLCGSGSGIGPEDVLEYLNYNCLFFIAAYKLVGSHKAYVGFVAVRPDSGSAKEEDILPNLYIELICGKGHKGVGAMLISKVEYIGKTLEKKAIDLNSLHFNNLVKYYEKLEFQKLPTNKIDIVPMRKLISKTRKRRFGGGRTRRRGRRS